MRLVTVGAAPLTDYVTAIFAAAGCETGEAATIAGHLVMANLTGHDSHGVVRVPRYVQWLGEGKVVAGQRLVIVRESATHAMVDGGFGFGQVIGEQAVDLGVAKARAQGLAVIALSRSGHIGRIGDWAERAAEAGLVSIHFVNVAGGELVAPFGGVERRFATNPVCIGVPSASGLLLLDFATSLVAEGKVAVASFGGKPVPADSMITADGERTGDPAALYGALEGTAARDPAGGTGSLRAFGEHKGSGLAFMCEILGGCLTGGETAGPVPGGKRARISNGMLSFYLDPGHFAGAGFAQAAADYAAYVAGTRPAAGASEVLLPGEPERRMREQRRRDGVPLAEGAWAAIRETASGVGVAAPALSAPA